MAHAVASAPARRSRHISKIIRFSSDDTSCGERSSLTTRSSTSARNRAAGPECERRGASTLNLAGRRSAPARRHPRADEQGLAQMLAAQLFAVKLFRHAIEVASFDAHRVVAGIAQHCAEQSMTRLLLFVIATRSQIGQVPSACSSPRPGRRRSAGCRPAAPGDSRGSRHGSSRDGGGWAASSCS